MRVFVLLSLLLCFNAAFGQTEFALYRLHSTLPQSNMLNPAFSPGFKVVIGLPVISSVRASADLDRIAFADIFNRSGAESLNLDTALISAKMKDVNHLRLNQSIQLFYLGMTLGKNYVSVGVHEVSDVTMKYPGDLVGWAIRGPGHPQYVGRPLDLGNLYGKGMAYTKTSISLGRSFGHRLRLGARLNYLLGLGMVESTKLSGQLIAGIDSVAVQTGEIQVNTSGVDFFTGRPRNAREYLNYITRTNNKGVAWDFGATYQITKRLSASAAVTNIGFINWKDYNRSYHHDPVTYTYRGIDLFDYLGDSLQFSVEDELDSLRGLFAPTETRGKQFRTQFIGKGYAGINYRVFGMNNLNALIAFDLLRGKTNPALSVGYSMQLAEVLNANIGVTLRHGKVDNIGAGLAFRITNFQIFGVSERAQSFVHPSRATRADIHAGMNLVFGKLDEDPLLNADENEPRSKSGRPFEKKRVAAAASRAQKYPTKGNKGGGDRDELSHIVVVGSFTSRDKADRYSRELRQRSITSKLGYDSEASVYRVYVYRSRDRGEARRVLNTFRKNSEFRIAGIRVLGIVDSKFD